MASVADPAGSRRWAAFLRPTSFPTPRVSRNMAAAEKEGFSSIFLGAMREEGLPRDEVWQGFRVRRVGPRYDEGLRGYALGTPGFVLSAARALRAIRPAIVHASDFEAMLAALLYRAVAGSVPIVYNIHDNLALRHPFPAPVRDGLARLEGRIAATADVVMVPDADRLETLNGPRLRTSVVIPNTLPDPGARPWERSGPVRVFLGGWLSWRRGVRTVGDLVSNRADVDLVVCGTGPNDVRDYLARLPRTTVYGYRPQPEALELAGASDLIVALYDPSVEINRFASPNKLYDAMALGKPVVVNQEMRVADWVSRKGIGYLVPYGEPGALSRVVDDVLSDPEAARRMGERGRRLYEDEFRWEVLEDRVRGAFRRLA